MSTNRSITQHDRDNAKRLKAHWDAKRIQLGLTQVKAAALLGYKTQSMISQQLNADAALNTDSILKWAQLLQISPNDIDPSMSALGFTKSQLRPVKVAIVATMSGAPANPFDAVEIFTEMTRQVYGVSVDTEGFEPLARKGSTLIVSQDEEPISGDEVFIQLQTKAGSLQLIKHYVTTDMHRGVAVVRDLANGDTEELPLEHIVIMDPIISVERPIVNRPIRIGAKRVTS